jgi:hypothetical protein
MTSAYPLQWPDGWERTPTYKRTEMRQNRLTFSQILDKTYIELERLKAQHVVVSSWLPLNMRGQPYAEQARRNLDDPGVAVYFTYRNKSMVMARDAFHTVADNLNSLRLAIQYLRGLERHGGGTMMDRAFEGFAQLAAPGSDDWRSLLGQQDSLEMAEVVYRQLAKKAHPNVPGGSHEAMIKLNRAMEQARAFFGGKSNAATL